MATGNDPKGQRDNDAAAMDGDGDDAVIGQAFRYSLAVIGGLVLIAGLVYLALRRTPEVAKNKETEQQALSTRSENENAQAGAGEAVRIPAVTFSDVTDVVLEEGVCVDDVLLVTEARGWLDDNGYENQDVIEYVVQGWEELLALSEDDGVGSEESDPDSYTESSEE